MAVEKEVDRLTRKLEQRTQMLDLMSERLGELMEENATLKERNESLEGMLREQGIDPVHLVRRKHRKLVFP